MRLGYTTARTHDEMLRQARDFLRRRKPVILDAPYVRRQQRREAKALAQEAGVLFLAVECVVDGELVRERLKQRRSAVWSPSDGRWEVYEAQLARAEPISELRDEQRLSLDGKLPLTEQIARVQARGEGSRGIQERLAPRH